ncbi:cytochrome P450 2D27-like [Leucoraja erinacea]|uniref:cytochrome P450 2D27-like n=1 Tax=Leucoraja erinaceus TaxID=7782 RepID=UPI002457773A|nr:cytochrome P450 2D27-like [Leucoraja erinacea]
MEFSALPGVVLGVFGGFPALAVFCTVFALAFDLMKRWKKCGNYPPGPRALPFLGNLLQVDLRNPHLSFAKVNTSSGILSLYRASSLLNTLEPASAGVISSRPHAFSHLLHFKLRQKYGDVMSLDYGWTYVVVLSGYKALKEALVKKSEDFAGRPDLPIFSTLSADWRSSHIDRVIGNGRKPKLEDREEMPFTNAVIHETQRLGNILPISLPHETYRDTEVMGYAIPKGTTIFPNITSVMYDEDIWLTPCEFNPGHFLNSGGMFVKPEAFIPFSAGNVGFMDC